MGKLALGHPVVGRDYHLLASFVRTREGDETALVSGLLSVGGEQWQPLCEELQGLLVSEVLKREGSDAEDRVYRRRNGSEYDFEECNDCRGKPGSPVLCEMCLLRRAGHSEGYCGCYILWDMDKRYMGFDVPTNHHARCGRELGPIQDARRRIIFNYSR